MKKRIRRPIPHASLYASAIVLRHMRELAATRGVKVNEVMLAGLDVIFKQNGLPGIGDIEGGTSTDNLNRIIHGIPARKGRGDAASKPKREKEFAV
jgi:hypothetical protein